MKLGDRVKVKKSASLHRGPLGYDLPDAIVKCTGGFYGAGRVQQLYGWSSTRPWKQDDEPVEAIFIGWRTLTDGYRTPGGGSWDDYDPPEYHVVASYRVALVVFDERTNPVYVFPSACEAMRDD